MSPIILTTQEELARLVERVVRRTLLDVESKGAKVPESQLLTVKEAASFLDLAVPTLYKLTSNREIPFFKRGKRVYFRKEELVKWVEQGRKKTREEIAEEVAVGLHEKGDKS